MEHRQGIHSRRSEACGWAGSSLDGPPPDTQRNPLDLAHRSTTAGSTQEVRGTSHRPSTLPELGGPWRQTPDRCRIGRRLTSGRETRFDGNLSGRQLFSGQKGGSRVGKTKRGKGTKIMAVADGNGLPIALHTEAALPAEVTLAESTIENRHVSAAPFFVVADKAYDSDLLRERMADRDMILIAP
jgi:hypothetical protein